MKRHFANKTESIAARRLGESIPNPARRQRGVATALWVIFIAGAFVMIAALITALFIMKDGGKKDGKPQSGGKLPDAMLASPALKYGPGDIPEGAQVVSPEAGGLAVAYLDGYYGLVDTEGRLVGKMDCQMLRAPADGMAACFKDGKWGYLNLKGEMAVKPAYALANDFRDGKAMVMKEAGKFLLIDKDGMDLASHKADGVQIIYAGDLPPLENSKESRSKEKARERNASNSDSKSTSQSQSQSLPEPENQSTFQIASAAKAQGGANPDSSEQDSGEKSAILSMGIPSNHPTYYVAATRIPKKERKPNGPDMRYDLLDSSFAEVASDVGSPDFVVFGGEFIGVANLMDPMKSFLVDLRTGKRVLFEIPDSDVTVRMVNTDGIPLAITGEGAGGYSLTDEWNERIARYREASLARKGKAGRSSRGIKGRKDKYSALHASPVGHGMSAAPGNILSSVDSGGAPESQVLDEMVQGAESMAKGVWKVGAKEGFYFEAGGTRYFYSQVKYKEPKLFKLGAKDNGLIDGLELPLERRSFNYYGTLEDDPEFAEFKPYHKDFSKNFECVENNPHTIYHPDRYEVKKPDGSTLSFKKYEDILFTSCERSGMEGAKGAASTLGDKFAFNDNLAAVKNNGKWGYIDRNGKVAIPFEFDGATLYNNGRAFVKKDGLWGVVDGKGAMITPFMYEDAGMFVDGLANAKMGGLWGYIDVTGRTRLPFQYENPGDFNAALGKLRLVDGGPTFFVDMAGRTRGMCKD